MQPARDYTAAVRRFNRFYTRRIDVLRGDYLGSPFSLTEARVVFELGQRDEVTATELGGLLDVDLGYMSRLLQGLRRRGMVQSKRSAHDARQSLLSLTDKGRKAYAGLNSRSRDKTAEMLAPLGARDRRTLVEALETVEALLAPKTAQEPVEITLRAHRPGDLGWVVQSHGRLYHQEYGWDERFEALVAGIVAKFVQELDPRRERCWIAEMGGEPVGSVFVVKGEARAEAKLRLLLIEPRARGIGLGRRLVGECIAFARARGYRTLVLWTQSNLAAARHIYRELGFALVKQERHSDFGVKLVGEYWRLQL